MICKICGSQSDHFAVKKVLHKYDVEYYQCTRCSFIQTQDPYWLPESYKSAITDLDIGLVYRNEWLAPIVATIIDRFFNNKSKFIDYGGGYGLFVRMMRDRGFDFYRLDKYCENLFAKHFDFEDLLPQHQNRFELLCAFEVFEHLQNPLEEIDRMISLSDHILFTTELQPLKREELHSWWYFTPETGQHISLYSRDSLNEIASNFNLHVVSHNNLHLLSKKRLSHSSYKKCFGALTQRFTRMKNRKPSLLSQDFEKIKHFSQSKSSPS